IDVNCTNEEIFMHLEKMMSGSPPPRNVMTDVNPYKLNPSNFADGMWYFVCREEKVATVHGVWIAKGEACELFSNSFIIGRMTTLDYYEGQVPHGHKTNWVMQEFKITEKRQSKNSNAKEAGSLCRVFLGCRPSLSNEKQQTSSFSGDTSRETHNHPKEMICRNAENNCRQGSTSKPQV
ncbi:NAM domain-containing protein, partial [Cephalotus follicularis]